ncbi:helix-turn-helix transcriptional regulator [Megamonas hypermegale]|uniref:helix-turn-helix transcriptional regulator n=1 Tax=Megamonas hypermegale TaxID=158847 RepID=UPI0026EE5592|nr:helix-turn-helix domain-containing protein [Megamonas hypermegale]
MKRTQLKEFRNKLGLTQVQMAEKLGISLIHYKLIEQGKANPSLKLVLKFREEFKDQYDDIWEFFGTLSVSNSQQNE